MIQVISATEARNNFFSIIDQSFLEKKRFLVKKGKIPMAYVIPTSDMTDQGLTDNLIDRINKIRKKTKRGIDSVELIRQMRNER